MNTISGGYSSITHGESALQGAKISHEKSKFESLLHVSSSMVAKEGRLNGDYGTGFADSYKGADAASSKPIGAAANQANPTAKQGTIDRTSELYEKSLEMESYIVKMMLSSMRKTIVRADGSNDFARNMYEDMLYDEYATAMTKNAGFGLADQMYLQLSGQMGVDAKSVLA